MKKAYLSKNITSNTTTNVCETNGILHYIVVNTTAAGSIIANDGTGGTTLLTLKASVAEGTYEYHIPFNNNLSIITAASPDITVVYSLS